MVNVLIREVTLGMGTGRRSHKTTGLVDCFQPQHSTFSTGNEFQMPPPASQIGTNFFALMTISGAANGPMIFTRDDLLFGNPVPKITVGIHDINILCMYLPMGGGGAGGPGSPGVYVDAFDMDQGAFLDDDFVSILVNSNTDASLSVSVNDSGFIPSDTAANEVARAYTTIKTLSFGKWQSLWGSQLIMGADLTVGQGTTAFYLALYTVPDFPLVEPKYKCLYLKPTDVPLVEPKHKCPYLKPGDESIPGYCKPKIHSPSIHNCPEDLTLPCKPVNPDDLLHSPEVALILHEMDMENIQVLADELKKGNKIVRHKFQKQLDLMPPSSQKTILFMLNKIQSEQ
jgi:hypothetical protein